MKPEFLLAKLDRMPMLKAVVPFAAGILAADRFALPLWFLAGTFLLSGVSALLLRSPLCTLAMLFTAGFGAAQLRDTGRTVPYGVTRPMNSPSRASPPTGAAMLPPKRPSRRGATRPTARGTPQATG
ncbi:hypothetical protein [Alistipes finegoldii]|uniref:hypothetical protein n=1 Tax=Alistipes finegoldii TaxID=214856 RepID=UPI00307A21B9